MFFILFYINTRHLGALVILASGSLYPWVSAFNRTERQLTGPPGTRCQGAGQGWSQQPPITQPGSCPRSQQDPGTATTGPHCYQTAEHPNTWSLCVLLVWCQHVEWCLNQQSPTFCCTQRAGGQSMPSDIPEVPTLLANIFNVANM